MHGEPLGRMPAVVVLLLHLLFVTGARAEGELSLTNGGLIAVWNMRNGGLSSLSLVGDADGMNWIEGCRTWGEMRAYEPTFDAKGPWHGHPMPYFTFKGLSRDGDAVVSRYASGSISVSVRRMLDASGLAERYELTNTGDAPISFLRGQFGILTTFNDSYGPAWECERLRCNAHIFAHGTNAYVHAVKMGPYPTDVVLDLTEGALDGYSQQIDLRKSSNDRGDIVLHPAPFVLLAGETKTLAWRISSRPAGTFSPPVRVRYETCFPGESFEVVTRDGHVRSVRAEHPGELEAEGARLYVSEPLDKLIRRRIDFIVSRQQCLDERSPLYGAFLIYDTEDRCVYFDNRWRDHNASRERLGMGLLLARWLQTHDSARVRAALDLFERFVFREFVDRESGAVYDTIGKNPSFKRLYNAPWAITFLAELYRLKRDESYLDTAERAILDYYEKGGDRFYPNGCAFGEVIALLRESGRDVSAVLAAHRRHIDTLLKNGTDYPPHEVKFEQTIVTPAVRILSSYWLNVERDPKVREAIDRHIAVLTRFDGDQPDHLAGGMPIRHWDGYWFGKLHSYGDNLHYWSVLSAEAYRLYARMTGDASYDERAERCYRNILCLYRPDGRASCAYYVPLMMSLTDPEGGDLGASVRGERFDPWANDQDFGLYFILRDGIACGLARREK